jgi:hypothetical protein
LPIPEPKSQILPRGLLDALAYPIYWMPGDNRSSEYPFRDALFAVAIALVLFGIGKSLIRRTTIFTRRDVQLLIFFAVSYVSCVEIEGAKLSTAIEVCPLVMREQ